METKMQARLRAGRKLSFFGRMASEFGESLKPWQCNRVAGVVLRESGRKGETGGNANSSVECKFSPPKTLKIKDL
jgi:hypothetical protein